MRSLFILLTLSFLVVFMAAGCAGPGLHRTAPRISLVDVQIQEIRPLETVFRVYLRVLNADDRSLAIRSIDCDLNINGRHFGSGLSGLDHTIPPYDSALVPVTVYSSTLEMVSSVVDLISQAEQGRPPAEPLRYELEGHVRTGEGGWMSGKIPFHARGRLFLPGSS